MAIAPITGMLRRGLVLDLSVAFGLGWRKFAPRETVQLTRYVTIGLGTSFGYLYWYGYHVPAVRKRDAFYSKLEEKRAAEAKA